MRTRLRLRLLPLPLASMCMTRKYTGDEAGLSLVEAMVSMAILSIAALGIGGILTMSFQQTNSAENVLNSQTYGMATAVGGTSSAADVINNVNISTSATASASSIPDAVMASASSPTSTSVSVTTAPVTSGTNLPSWWLP